MWLSTLLRKMTQGPDVGETFRNYIGCYMYGREVHGSGQPEYIGAPATHETLHSELQTYLHDLLHAPDNAHSPHLPALRALCADLPAQLQRHLASDMRAPLLQLGDVSLFVRKGVRQRRQVDGKFVE